MHTIVENVEVAGYRRTMAEATLGHVWTVAGEGRVPVHALSDPSVGSDNHPTCYSERWYESRGKRFVASESERESLISQGWRDDGVVFYVPASASDATTTVSTSSRLYYAEGSEAAMRGGEPAFEVLSAAAPGTQPLMRVHYWKACGSAHDELVVGRPRFDRARYQGSRHPHFGLHWSGLRGETTLVVEALGAQCPWRNAFVAPVSANAADAEYRSADWRTPEELRAASPVGDLYVNGQGDPANEPVPIARAFITLRPEPAPELDWSYGWTADDTLGPIESESCLAGNAADCGASHWYRTPSAVFEMNSVPPPFFGAREMLSELWVGLVDMSAGTKFRLFPTTHGEMRADAFLYATMSVDAFTTARRYPQIIIADANIPYPVGQNMESGNALVVQTFFDWPGRYELEVCNRRQWEVNNQCPTYPDSRWVLDPANPDLNNPVAIAPVIDAYERTTALDQQVRFEVYASTSRAYLFLDGHPYGCMDLPASGVPTGEVTVAFGDVVYHAGAETPHSDFLDTRDQGVSIRHFDNLGFRSGVPGPTWDEARLPCRPASMLGL